MRLGVMCNATPHRKCSHSYQIPLPFPLPPSSTSSRRALEDMVDEGLIRGLGVSNFSLAGIDEILSFARVKPVINQVELHPCRPQRKLVGGLLRRGLRAVAFSPLGHSKQELLENPAVVALADELGVSSAQVLLRWNVQRGVGAIPKAGSEHHARQNFDVFSFSLSYAQKVG